jgi:hypothetical protein
MPSFREVLTASDAELVKTFYKVKPSADNDFIKKINDTAAQIELNHTQLVCALGFNTNIRDLTDILSVVGFSSYKLLTYRRNELFANDTYQHLDIDNVVDIYAEHIEDEDILATLRELLPARLTNIEKKLAEAADPGTVISYKMELHSIYSGGVATGELVNQRLEAPIGDLRVMVEEIQMIVDAELLPPGNLFFSDDLLPVEKKFLIENGDIDQAMIQNRLNNVEISEDERQMLEDFAE